MNARRQSGFSLLEIMVSMTLLVLIVGGLMVVFNYTTRGLRAISNTTDVFENARALVSLVSRDVAELAPVGDYEYTNLLAYTVTNVVLPLPGTGNTTNTLQDMFFISRQNDQWIGTGYFIDRTAKSGAVGTLYRFSAETNGPYPRPDWITNFLRTTIASTNVHRVADGVVHFKLSTYDAMGRVYWQFPYPGWTNTTAGSNLPPGVAQDIENNVFVRADGGEIRFQKSYLPAFVDLEIGILEPETARKFYAIDAANSAAARTFLTDQAGKMHLFRQRIAIRNHTLPPAFE
jgi:prepilin-type N-terminal cleavage/methylation domain-containing protein